MKKTLLALALVAGMPAAAQAQDAEAGKAVFNQCRACHAVGETAKNQVGPQLNGIIGRKAASVDGFKYSEAMAGWGKDKAWDEKTFAEYIANPKGYIPGNKMVFVGIKDEQKIKDLTAFLKQYAADGKVAAK
jgi:cytochrome c